MLMQYCFTNKQTYAETVLLTIFSLVSQREGRLFPVTIPTYAPDGERYPPALAMLFINLLFLRPGVFLLEDLPLGRQLPIEKLCRLHFRIHLEWKN